MKPHIRFVTTGLLCCLAHAVPAANYLYSELAEYVRFEQYNTVMALWRLPNPGASTFPGGSCVNLTWPSGTAAEVNSRFMALYMFAKTNNKEYFVQYDTSTCLIISFGMDG